MSRRVRAAAALIAAGTLLAGCQAARSDAPSDLFAGNGVVVPAAQRNVTPRLAGPTLTEESLDVRSWRGHVVVVNIWGSWCAPCRKEAPDLARLALLTAPQGVKFLGIDLKDSRPSAIAFERSFGIAYPSLFDPAGRAAMAFGPLAVQAVPTTYILDVRGRVAARFVGRTSFEPLRDSIELVRTGRVAPSRFPSPSLASAATRGESTRQTVGGPLRVIGGEAVSSA